MTSCPACPECGTPAEQALVVTEFGDVSMTLACQQCGTWWTVIRRDGTADWQIAEPEGTR